MIINPEEFPLRKAEFEILDYIAEILEDDIELSDTDYSEYDNMVKIKRKSIVKLRLRSYRPEIIPLINELPHLLKFYIYNTPIDIFPVDLFQNKTLKLIDFRKNSISCFPSFSHQNNSLEYLELSDNNLERIPESIGNLSKLNFFDLLSNKIRSLPVTLEKLENLEYLRLGQNNLGEFPHISQNYALKELSLEMNNLTHIPFCPNLQNLRILNLRANFITDFSLEYFYLPSIQEISLADNPVRIPQKEIEIFQKKGKKFFQ